MIALCLATVLAGCGSRLTRQEILAQNADTATGVGAAGAASVGQGDDLPQEVPPDESVASGGAPATTTAGSLESRNSATSPGRPGTRGASGNQAPSGPKKRITLGLIGFFSGVGGPVHTPKRDAFLVWAKWVNAHGGLHGHPVEMLWADDGGSEAQAASIARDFVENKGAVALSITGSVENSVVSYATKKSIPVIGVSGGSEAAQNSPMMFRTSPGGRDGVWGAVALAKAAGVKKVAIFYCAEAVECQATSDSYAKEAQAQGLQVVYAGKNSVTQPDFTADCLQAKNSGAELVYPITDNTAPVRMAQSCSRQGFKPIWELGSSSDAQAKIPELEGAISASDAFPWFLRTGVPGITEYASAFKAHLPSRLSDGTRDQASAWTAAKVFEAAALAATKYGKQRVGSPDILEGLWSLRGETLDGIAPGGMARTYRKGQPSPLTFCIFSVKIHSSKWIAPRGLTPLCK